jgi:hypothetical protein
MTLDIFNTAIGIISLLLAIFATTKVLSLKSQINNHSGNNSPITTTSQMVKGNKNVTAGGNVKL